MQVLPVRIQPFTQNDRELFLQLVEKASAMDDLGYYEDCIARNELGDILIVLAFLDEEMVGYTFFNLKPKYALFKKLGIPEVQDLNVISSARRQGVGHALIAFCEKYAKDQGFDELGIGVGLHQSFGAAQRLYVQMGYIPDGTGVCYDRKQVAAGEFRPIDDQLNLMMVKNLR